MPADAAVAPKPHKQREKRPPRDSVAGMQSAAERGDLSALVDCLNHGASMYLPQREKALIDACLKANASKGVNHLIERLTEHILLSDTRLMVRAQVVAANQLRCLEMSNHGMAQIGALPPGVVESLERTARLEDRVLEVAQTLVRMRRLSAMSMRERAASKGVLRLVKGLKGSDTHAASASVG